MKQPKVVWVCEAGTIDAWQALYIDGKLVLACPTIGHMDILEALKITPTIMSIPYGFDGKFPEKLSQLKTI